jgi:tetratricopeptide (TPR) repeat protein
LRFVVLLRFLSALRDNRAIYSKEFALRLKQTAPLQDTNSPFAHKRPTSLLQTIIKTFMIFGAAAAFAFGANVEAEKAFDRGLSAYNKGDYKTTIADFTQAIKLDPNDAMAYNNRGIAYDELGDYGKAIADYTQAIKLDPSFAYAYYNRGNAYDDLGDYKTAIDDYNQAIKLDPNYAEAYCNRGVAYLALGDHKTALADWTQAIKLNPNYADAYGNRGNVYALLNDLKSATKDARIACELGNCNLLQLMAKNKDLRD